MPRQRTSITIDPWLWKRFKATLALQSRDMSPVLETFIEAYLQEHEEAAREAARQGHDEHGPAQADQ